MPANNTGTIQVGTPVVDLAVYDFSKQDTAALLSQIPVDGTGLVLPIADTVMESYEWYDVDGSCSSTHPVTVASQGGQLIHGATTLEFTVPFSWARFVWSGTGWAVESGSGSGSTVQASDFFETGPATVALTAAPVTVLSATITFPIVRTTQRIYVWANALITDGAPTGGDDSTLEILIDAGVVSSASFLTDPTVTVQAAAQYAATGLAVGNHTLDVQALCASGDGAAGHAKVTLFIFG